MAQNNQTEPEKTLIWGVIYILVAWWLCFSSIDNPFHELALIRRAHIVEGYLVDTHEDERADYRDNVYSSDIGVYKYQLPDGREFKTISKRPTGKLRAKRKIEYLPDNPAVSRIKGDGCRSIVEWLWRKLLLGVFLLAIISSPGIVLISNAIRDMKRIRDKTKFL